ncbi:MAG: glycosyltransferase family 39 protein [Candidatus Sumerlaeaceae bacterium]|nr:glycosyltransferase family 39 protein [Candidatus Sumerlaeaceae bacterium]
MQGQRGRNRFLDFLEIHDPLVLRRSAFTVGILALLARLAYYYELSGKPYFGAPLLDSRWWLQEAQAWLQMGISERSFFRPPLYTGFLAGILSVAGQAAPFIVPLIQLLLGVVFCVILVYLASRIWSISAGLAAGCLAALYSPLVFYEAEILSDSLTIFWLVLFLFELVRGIQEQRVKHYVWAGIWAGVAALTRANALPLGLAVLIGLIIQCAFRCEAKPHWRHILAFILPLATLVLLPTAHNVSVGDPVIICGQGGINFFIGNNPAANGVNVIIPRWTEQGSRYRDTVEEFAVLGYLSHEYGKDQALLRYESGERPPWHVLDRFWYAEGISYLINDPRAAIGLYVKKLVALLNNWEVRNNRDFNIARIHESVVLRLLPFGFGVVLALAANGLRWWRQAPRRGIGWIVLYLLVSCAVVLAYLVAGRLRLIILPALFVLAAVGVERVFRALLLSDLRELARAGATIVVVGAASCYYWPQMDFRYSPEQLMGDGIRATSFAAGEWAMLANASLENGHAQQAAEYATRSLAADPSFAFAWLILGNSLLAVDEVDRALSAYARALALEPASLRVRNNLAVGLEKKGQFQEAAETYLDVLRADPADPRANANLAALLLRSGDKSAARSFAQTALENDPEQLLARAIVELTQTQEETTPPKHRNMLTPHFLKELNSPLPQRIDLTSSRPLAVLLKDAGVSTGGLDLLIFSGQLFRKSAE